MMIDLLLPVLSAARDVARSTQCVNNVPQIALALNLDAEDYGGYVPYDGDASGIVGNTWVERIAFYLGYKWDARYKPVLSCPNAATRMEIYANGSLPASRTFSNYGGNPYYFVNLVSLPGPTSLHLTRSPSKTMLLMDGRNGGHRLLYADDLNNVTRRPQPFRHGDRANVFFADMHGSPLPIEDVPYGPVKAMPNELFWNPMAQ